MGGPTDMGRKGYISIGYYTYIVTFSFDLDLGNAVFQEWEGRHGTKG